MTDTRNVHQRKLAVMKRCGAIVPDKDHALKFRYVSIQALSNHLREFCVEAGLGIDVRIVDNEVIVRLTNVDEPTDVIESTWPVMAADKGFAYSVKYPLMRTFLIGDGEENDEASMANQPALKRKARPTAEAVREAVVTNTAAYPWPADQTVLIDEETPNQRLERIRAEARAKSRVPE